MTSKVTKTEIITSTKWIHLIKAYTSVKGVAQEWIYCTRKNGKETELKADAVIPVAIIQEECPKIILIREFRAAIGDYQISLPAGLIDNGESPIVAANRELLEETGYELKTIIQESPILDTSAGLTDETFCYVFCTAEYKQVPQTEPTEDIEIMILDMQELKTLLTTPNIRICGRTWSICHPFIQNNEFPL